MSAQERPATAKQLKYLRFLVKTAKEAGYDLKGWTPKGATLQAASTKIGELKKAQANGWGNPQPSPAAKPPMVTELKKGSDLCTFEPLADGRVRMTNTFVRARSSKRKTAKEVDRQTAKECYRGFLAAGFRVHRQWPVEEKAAPLTCPDGCCGQENLAETIEREKAQMGEGRGYREMVSRPGDGDTMSIEVIQ